MKEILRGNGYPLVHHLKRKLPHTCCQGSAENFLLMYKVFFRMSFEISTTTLSAIFR